MNGASRSTWSTGTPAASPAWPGANGKTPARSSRIVTCLATWPATSGSPPPTAPRWRPCTSAGRGQRWSRWPDSDAPVPGSAEQFADPRDDLAAVQLDVGHELFVCEAGHAVLQVEPGRAKDAQAGGDLPGDGLRRADVQRFGWSGFGVERLLGRDRKAALGGDERDDVPPPRPELRFRLLVGGRDVARRVHHHRQRRAAGLLQ